MERLVPPETGDRGEDISVPLRTLKVEVQKDIGSVFPASPFLLYRTEIQGVISVTYKRSLHVVFRK